MDRPSAASAASGNQSEAERLLGIAEKLLESRDLTGSREFAVLAQESEPLLEGSDQILAICDVLLAGDKRVDVTGNSKHDWYAILQVDRRCSDLDLMKRNYRRLALLLHPDKNKYPLSNSAFRLVADAWAVLSDQAKKSAYDGEVGRFSRVELTPTRASNNQPDSGKLPARRSSRVGAGVGVAVGGADRSGLGSGSGGGVSTPRPSNFWTACPYCYVLYEYPRVYEDCCLRCQSCQRAFHAALVQSLPPVVPGKEAYYCCWGFFPLGFSLAGSAGKKGAPNSAAFPNWMPPMFSGAPEENAAKDASPANAAAPTRAEDHQSVRRESVLNFSDGSASAGAQQAAAGINTKPPPKKRGRPRKNP